MKRIELFRDSLQNYKSYQLPKCQLLIVDIPYGISENAYASSPQWYKNGDNSNGESELAKKQFFYNDNEFREAEFWHFASKMLIKEPKEVGKAPCMIIFCAFDQQMHLIELGKKYGFNHYINLVFRKNFHHPTVKPVKLLEYLIMTYCK